MSWPKVLVVDDEVEFATALAERLLLRNYDAKAVYGADEALRVVHEDPPDVILLDLRMPGIDGTRVLQTIKESNPDIEVIMLTGHGDPECARKVMETGAFDYVVKPVDIGNLTEKIDKALTKRRG